MEYTRLGLSVSSLWHDLADTFQELQSNTIFFLFECLLLIYFIIALTFTVDKFILPALIKMAENRRISRDMTGIVVALGNMVPEFCAVVVGFLTTGIDSTEFAIGINIGHGSFTMTFVPAVAILVAYNKI
jgi:Ca2+/Na+ antiporter